MGKTDDKTCVIIGGSPALDLRFLDQEIDRDAFLICADAGYLHAMEIGLVPDLIVGDFDSGKVPPDTFSVIRLPAEKDETDTYFAAMEALRRGYRSLVFYGVLGGRFDHSYANVLILEAVRRRGGRAVIRDRGCTMFLSGSRRLCVPRGDFRFLSLFPFLGHVEGLSIQGVKYPLDHIHLDIGSPLCISNEILAEEAVITTESGTLLVIRSND